MRHFYALVAPFFFVVAGPVSAQNLVPNPGFETYTACPSADFSNGEINKAPPWNKPTDGTADYFHTCSTAPFGQAWSSVPSNIFGNQTPHAGNAYVGFTLYFVGGATNLREYIQAPLPNPLAAGQSYKVSFYVSLADKSKWAIDGIGAHFSNGSVSQHGTSSNPWHWVLPLTPQVSNPSGNVISNKTGWVLVQGTFVANGGENHIIIGNFKDDTNTTKTAVTGTEDKAYYYIDDVTVVPDKPKYDISLKKTKAQGTNYLITLINVGSPIVGPAKITIQDAYPAGLTVTGGSGSGVSGATWTMNPGAGTVGPATITLTYTITSGTTVPTNGQIALFGINGMVSAKNCAKATQLSVNNVAVTETNTANNGACVQ